MKRNRTSAFSSVAPSAPEHPAPLADSSDNVIAERAVTLAGELLREALAQQSPAEHSRARNIAGLIADPSAKALSIAMTDRIFRAADPRRAAKGWRDTLSMFDYVNLFRHRHGNPVARGSSAMKDRNHARAELVALPKQP